MEEFTANPNPLSFDLYCVETTMEEAGEEDEREVFRADEACLPMRDQNEEKMLLFWEDDELVHLSNKEKQQSPVYQTTRPFLFSARMEGVRWLMLASTQLGFNTQTTILAVHYLDRFLSSEGSKISESQPWLIQLCSVTCLSIAAKLEETHVPLLLDLQVEDTRFVFEAKTLQRMELLVLSTLDWKMNPITPLSFVDHMVRRMASENRKNKPQHWKFQKMCHSTLLSAVADSRWLEYLPSVLAAATMLHVVDQMEMEECGDRIISLLNTNQEEVDRCYKFVLGTISMSEARNATANHKRKYRCHYPPPPSPDGIIGTSVFSFDSSNDSWSSSPQHYYSQPHHHHPVLKSKRPSSSSTTSRAQ